MKIHDQIIDQFTEDALECLFWQAGEEELEALSDLGFFDIEENSLKKFMERCHKFQEENAENIEIYPKCAGHDYVLTVNGHGAGFWDLYKVSEAEEKAGKELTESCHKETPFYIFVQDGKVYIESM